MDEAYLTPQISSSDQLIEQMAQKIAALPEPTRSLLDHDLKCLKASLRASEQGMDEILDEMMEGCQVLDGEGRYVYINAQARQTFTEQGIDPAGLIGKKMLGEGLPIPEENVIGQAVRRVLDEHIPAELEYYSKPWKIWWQIRMVPRQAGGLLFFTKDITRRKKVIEALTVSEKKLSDLIKHAPAGIYEIDFRTRRFTTVNDAMCELTGYSREELLALDPFEIMDEAGRQTFQRRIDQWLAGQPPEENITYRVRAKDGHEIEAALNVSFKADENGLPVGAMVVGFDMTRARAAERERIEALRRAEETRLILEAIIEQMPVGIILTDAAGQNMKTNAEMDRIWRRIAPSDALADGHVATRPDGRQNRLEDWPLNQALRRGRPVLGQEMTIRRGDGTEGIIEASAAPVRDAAGSIIAGVVIVTDITERRWAEDALREGEAQLHESQSFLSKLVSTSYEGIWAVDATGTTTFINPRAAEILGYTVEEIRNQNAFQFLMAGHEAAARETLASIMRGESGRVEAHARHKNGSELRLMVSFSPMLGENGQFAGAMAMFSDITDQQRAAATLARKEGELREAQRQAHIGSWYWDPKTEQGEVSEEFYRIFGLDPAAGSFPSYVDQRGLFYPAEAWDRLNEAVQRCVQEGLSYEMDIPGLHCGEPIWVTARGEVVRDDSGQVIALRGTVQDITERKQIEDALRASEARERNRASELEALMDAVPAMLWITRDPACREMIGNPFGYQFLKMGPQDNLSKTAPEADLARQPYQNMKDGLPLPGSELPMQIAAATGKSFRDYEFDILFTSGELYHLLGNVNPLFDAAGKPSGAVGAFIDVTALRRLQSQQVEALAERVVHHRLMEQREKERQSYARDIHDGPIQTLASIGFSLHYLKQTYPDAVLNDELDQIGKSVKTAVQELRQLINELRPPSVIRFGLSRAIKQHTEDIRERYPQIAWHNRLAEDTRVLPEPVCLALYRIYQESVSNIARHSEATQAWVRYQVKAREVVLEIKDNGKGFESHLDVEALTRDNHFGLAGITERAAAVGGTVKIISHVGEGTTVLVKVPISPRKEP